MNNLTLSQQLTDYKFIKQLSDDQECGYQNQQTFLIADLKNTNKTFLLTKFPISMLNDTNIKDHFNRLLLISQKLTQFKEADQYIIKYKTHFNDRYYFYLLHDHNNAMVLKDFIKKLPMLKFTLTSSARDYLCYQIIKGLSWIHSHKIIHGNVQLRSIWISMTNQIPYWTDFGFQMPTDPLFRSPDLSSSRIELDQNQSIAFNNYLKNIPQQKANDVWGLGIILYFLITGTYPIQLNEKMDRLTIAKTLRQLLIDNPPIDFPENYNINIPVARNPNKWKTFIQWILNPLWKKRPTSKQILEEFENNIM